MRGDLIAEECGDIRIDEEAEVGVAHHRVADPERGCGEFLFQFENDLHHRGGAHVAGQQGIGLGEGAALFHAVQNVADMGRVEYLPGPVAVSRVVGELDGVDGHDFDAHPLQRKDGGGVADMAVGDVGLDREDGFGFEIHGLFYSRSGLAAEAKIVGLPHFDKISLT